MSLVCGFVLFFYLVVCWHWLATEQRKWCLCQRFTCTFEESTLTLQGLEESPLPITAFLFPQNS